MAHDNRTTPHPGPDSEIPVERRPADEITGSRTGTIGGGGRDAHNPSPVRGTGVDDETVGAADIGSEDAFEDEDLDDEAFDDEEGDAEDVEKEE